MRSLAAGHDHFSATIFLPLFSSGCGWSSLDHSEFKGPEDEHLAIGRLLANFEP